MSYFPQVDGASIISGIKVSGYRFSDPGTDGTEYRCICLSSLDVFSITCNNQRIAISSSRHNVRSFVGIHFSPPSGKHTYADGSPVDWYNWEEYPGAEGNAVQIGKTLTDTRGRWFDDSPSATYRFTCETKAAGRKHR